MDLLSCWCGVKGDGYRSDFDRIQSRSRTLSNTFQTIILRIITHSPPIPTTTTTKDPTTPRIFRYVCKSRDKSGWEVFRSGYQEAVGGEGGG